MIKKISIFIVALSALLLVFSAYSDAFNPAVLWLPSLLGLLFPFLLCWNIFLLIIGLIPKKKWVALIPIIGILASLGAVANTISISFNARNTTEYSIMTWNVKNFDLYNWSNNEATRSLMFDVIEEADPDILCLQEFYTEDKGKFNNLKEVKNLLDYKYHYFKPTYVLNGSKKWGIITFSKYPIEGEGFINFEAGTRLNGCAYSDININGELFRVYNTHLQSYHFSDTDHAFLEEFSKNTAENIASSKSLILKLKNGFQNRSKQAIQLYNHKKLYAGKSIIIGDFNDTSVSFTYKLLSKNMKDAFVEKGFGFDKTYVNRSPFFRIDFTFVDPTIKVNRYKTIEKELSDHYPVITTFTF